MKLFLLIFSLCCFLYALVLRVTMKRIRRACIWIAVAAVLFALSLLWDVFSLRLKAAVVLLFLILAGVYVFYAVKIIKVIRDSKKDRPVEYLIVLGAQVFGRRPCVDLEYRLQGALARYAMHPKAKIIVSGGQGSDEEYSEAEVMREYLLKNGVDCTAILLEDRSKSTVENLKFSGELIGRADAPVGIVSNSYHLYRALEMAKNVGMKNASPVYAVSGWVTVLHQFTREVAALCWHDVKNLLRGNR